ncbi:hypothetical protein FJW07_03000 [Mesorhizobium sp. B3-1-9]|uniref:hypothetical protein n=1 Tax=unclassified Mesorhizobium TaxID=325217 RepID=UPI00112AF5D9|nr:MULTISPECIES: hypothetical protein [unclassified Mesorhizobium]TPI22452.1 hypothetical protein FJW10_03195 [Mesorhizobium sp. B4-1-1]TPI41415.1 hypothetical protein FJ414_08055 [Mesorhizobium sp. B3-1-6]TPI42911.1 hypothetical protein FJW07_03000 [Mesorhizobium sp. B3-1-9]TPI65120.1 hypothetical protein FJ417_00630 [Mesorhizobium sp. B3-1-7]TPI65673.1 hypothetical protein FJ424_15085 [Mesorhizobium sp. B3-1-8]
MPAMVKKQSNDNGSYFEFDVMREAFKRWVDEDKVPEDQWRPRATKLVRIVTGDDYVDPNIVEWIMRKKPQR